MTVKPIAAGTPQRIISKINELVNAVNTGGGSGGSGTADAILDTATIADAGKALGIDAEGEPALITVEGGGAPLLVCNLSYSGTGESDNPYVGYLDHAAEILDALDPETDYSPIICICCDVADETRQLTPAFVRHTTGDYEGTPYTINMFTAYGDWQTTSVTMNFKMGFQKMGDTVTRLIIDNIHSIQTMEWTVSDDILSYTNTDI